MSASAHTRFGIIASCGLIMGAVAGAGHAEGGPCGAPGEQAERPVAPAVHLESLLLKHSPRLAIQRPSPVTRGPKR
jgi:hypothetical protein